MRNCRLVTSLIIVCGLMIPFSIGVGFCREVPWFWTMVDSSFAVIGGLLLLMLHRAIGHLERLESEENRKSRYSALL